MKLFISLLAVVTIVAGEEDDFNYHSTSDNDYGPEEWDKVGCNNLATCPGWPDKLLGAKGWHPSQNDCKWCPIEGNDCGQHRQSPIDLHRDRAIAGNPNEKECPDWHWIQYQDGTCVWEDMADQFEIGRHTLSINMPLLANGDIDCVNDAGERRFPKLDYSKGFPDWWYLSRTDITVPSEHVQHGKRYAAEVKLSHFYEVDHYKNKLGIVSFFMQDFEGEPSWPYLDKLICKWRAEEEKTRQACGLPPAPVYKMCELYRGQVRTEADLETPTEAAVFPTIAPLVAPPAIPIEDLGPDPEDFRLPLSLCQGDCDFATDCATGLVCYRRDAFGAVPGCIGGESDPTDSDYCVFDPYGPGYIVPSPSPTNAPTITYRPTIVPLPAQPLTDYGGTPPVDKIPLQICEGDCDTDADCDLGLICFQRTSNESVPGCIGGETDANKTDYCILDPYGPGYVQDSAGSVPVASPTQAPVVNSNAPFTRPVGEPISLQNLGWEPPLPIAECAGDCDVDADCETGLICFQRNTANQEVPGCLGGNEDPSLTDYCTFPPLPTTAPNNSPSTLVPVNTWSPVSKPTPKPTPVNMNTPTDNATEVVEYPPLKDLGWTPPPEAKPLGRCEGDCDIRQDCADGLDCFQRYLPNLAVPGCSGGEADATMTDYCIPIEFMNGIPNVPAPSPVSPVAPTAGASGMNQTMAPVASSIPPLLDCSAFPDVSFFRMCKTDSCCTNPRSETEFCHDQYQLLGDDVESACHHCCLEEQGNSMSVGPDNVVHANITKLLQCDTVGQPERMCREGSSCCDSSGSASEFCQEKYQLYSPEEIESICWYCCYPSKAVNFTASRKLFHSTANDNGKRELSHAERKRLYNLVPVPLGENDRLTHDLSGRPVIVRAENFEEKGMLDEDEYFETLLSSFRGRSLQQSQAENYDDVQWWPYEWFLKVGTEYYFRYEGTQTAPPCYDTAHWRILKDPIRVAPHQMRELERLIAWRTGDNCEVDTAGKPTDDPDRVDVARPLQSYHKLHRMVFCECQDWPSKFTADRQWCRNWQNEPPEEHLFETPYNFPSDGFEFL